MVNKEFNLNIKLIGKGVYQNFNIYIGKDFFLKKEAMNLPSKEEYVREPRRMKDKAETMCLYYTLKK